MPYQRGVGIERTNLIVPALIFGRPNRVFG